MKPASCHSSNAKNFNVAPRFLENFVYPCHKTKKTGYRKGVTGSTLERTWKHFTCHVINNDFSINAWLRIIGHTLAYARVFQQRLAGAVYHDLYTVPFHSYYSIYHQTTARILASHNSMTVGTTDKSMLTTCVVYKITRLQTHSIFMYGQIFCTLR